MPWLKKRNGRLYYYRAVFHNGRRTNVYIGRGPLADLAAQQDAQAARDRAQRLQLAKRQRARDAALDKSVKELCLRTERLLRAALVAAGWRIHQMSEWRLSR